jgi:DNA-binding MarR family transcriptional regulator/GNAT superfamily N-acetyltransferase
MRMEERVAAVREFNRFYTKQIGVLSDGFLESPFSLTEVRVLYELAHRQAPRARELCADLGLDAGYLSRILQRFERSGLITRHAAKEDGRSSHLSLTAQGLKAFAPLEARSAAQVRARLRRLSASEQERVVARLRAVQKSLQPQPAAQTEWRPVYSLRAHRPGDMGWVTERHGALYAPEYDERFEALIAEVVAHFLRHFDPRYEHCWIAEVNGERAGSVFLVKSAPGVAKLRLLLVEPWARGLGIGRRLVEECIRFARQRGYRKIELWTQSELKVARHIYEATGFRIVERKRHRHFGKPLVAETWEMSLGRASKAERRVPKTKQVS